MEWGENVGGSCRWERIATTRHNRDGWCRFVSICLFARDLGNSHGGVMEWVVNVGGSSQWERIATTRHNRDGWCRFVSVCLFARDLGNIHGGVVEAGENVCEPSRSGQIATIVTTLTMVTIRHRLTVCDS